MVPQLVHLWQLPLGTMIDPHSGQVGASVRTRKLYMDGVLGLATVWAICSMTMTGLEEVTATAVVDSADLESSIPSDSSSVRRNLAPSQRNK